MAITTRVAGSRSASPASTTGEARRFPMNRDGRYYCDYCYLMIFDYRERHTALGKSYHQSCFKKMRSQRKEERMHSQEYWFRVASKLRRLPERPWYVVPLLLLLALPLLAEPSRCVFVDTKDNDGTGIFLHTNLVATAWHVVDPDTDLTVNGQKATVVKIVKDLDLAYLQVSSPEAHSIPFADGKVGEEAYYIGNPFIHRCITVYGRIVDKDAKFLYFDGRVIGGASGAPLFDRNGNLIGIIQALEVNEEGRQGFGVALQSKYIRRSMP